MGESKEAVGLGWLIAAEPCRLRPHRTARADERVRRAPSARAYFTPSVAIRAGGEATVVGRRRVRPVAVGAHETAAAVVRRAAHVLVARGDRRFGRAAGGAGGLVVPHHAAAAVVGGAPHVLVTRGHGGLGGGAGVLGCFFDGAARGLRLRGSGQGGGGNGNDQFCLHG